MPIVNRVADLLGEITAWRRDLHAHPELLYDVHRTAAAVAEKLKSFGCDEVVPGIGRTGVVGVIRGSKAGDKVIGNGLLLINAEAARVGANKTLIEDSAGKLVEVLFFQCVEHARADLGRTGDFIQRDATLLALLFQLRAE